MTRGFENEFKTVKLLVESNTTTGRNDAFIISFVKMEKQVRRIFSFLIYQYPAFDTTHKKTITDTISSKPFLYFENFIRGITALYSIPVRDIVGVDCFDSHQLNLIRIKSIRNKLLHGQLTGKSLSRNDLIREIDIVKDWCSIVAETMQVEIGYDGFERNSYRKNLLKDLVSNYQEQITSIQGLDAFIVSKMR